MNIKDIKKFYKDYKSQILKEIQEYMDQPLKNMKKISNTSYNVSEDGIDANIRFKKKYYTVPRPYFDINTVKNIYSMEWWWGDTDIENRTPKNFLRILASCYKVLDDFIKVKNPEVISFSGISKGHNSVYFGNTFQKRLKTLFGEKYDITYDETELVVYIINKEVSNIKSESINKRSKITSLQEATIYWKFNHLHPKTPLNIKIKSKIKKRVLEKIYF